MCGVGECGVCGFVDVSAISGLSICGGGDYGVWLYGTSAWSVLAVRLLRERLHGVRLLRVYNVYDGG